MADLSLTEQKMAEAVVVDPMGGANQTRVRAYNERLVLSLVRRHGSLSKADIARRTGLSAQTVSVIMRSLEKDGLLSRGEPQRGRVGQPSIPMSLNPDGVYSLGLKVGRRSCELALMDFVGAVRFTEAFAYRYPTPAIILDFVQRATASVRSHLTASRWQKVAGLGVALPFELWNWVEALGAPREDMDAWRETDVPAMLAEAIGLPVFLQNDATAACAAELAFGHGPRFADFAYFFIGTFVGGGVVLNHALFPGRTGNAGAFGSMPFRTADGASEQLIEHASILQLERKLQENGKDPSSIWLTPGHWDDFGQAKDQWIEDTASALAYAIGSACSVIDFEAVIVDGAFSDEVKTRIVDATRRAIGAVNFQGIAQPVVEAGLVGASPRAIGAASLPLFSRYHIDQSVLFKELA